MHLISLPWVETKLANCWCLASIWSSLLPDDIWPEPMLAEAYAALSPHLSDAVVVSVTSGNNVAQKLLSKAIVWLCFDIAAEIQQTLATSRRKCSSSLHVAQIVDNTLSRWGGRVQELLEEAMGTGQNG